MLMEPVQSESQTRSSQLKYLHDILVEKVLIKNSGFLQYLTLGDTHAQLDEPFLKVII